MEKICNQNFFNNSNKFIFFFLIYQILILSIKTNECEKCEYIPENEQCTPKEGVEEEKCRGCKPHLGNNEVCYNCENINGFYKIINNECVAVEEGCDNKIVDKTNECVGHCSDDTFEMEDYCIFKCDSDHYQKPNDKLKTCECLFKYKVKQEKNNKKQKECLAENSFCLYYDSDTHQCNENDDGCSNKKIRKFEDSNEIYYRCSNECVRGEYTYEKDDRIYCDGNCNEFIFYYHNSLSGINYCVDSCENEDFYDNNECVTQCKDNSNIIIIDLSQKTKIQCLPSTNNDVSNYFKYEEKYYFKDCSYTQQLKLFNNRITYNMESEDTKICVDKCDDNKYILEGTNNCTDCKGKFFYGKTCYNNCNSINLEYYIKNISSSSEDIPYECIKDCPVGYYKDNTQKICYINKCPQDAYKTNNFECIYECKNITNPPSIKKGEGYIIEIKDDDSEEITEKYCYSSCFINGENWYYKHKDNKCFKDSCQSQSPKLYSAYDNPYICYESCKDIGEEYVYEKDYICYKTLVTCDNYYYIINGVTQCVSYSECLDKFKYIKGKECTNECNLDYYRIEQIFNNNNEPQNIGGCFLDKKDCIKEGFNFYNNTEKICTKQCDTYKILSSEGKPIENEYGDTCFSSCPSNYPYKDLDKKLCLIRCDNYFYGNDCYDSCNNDKIQKYYFEGTKKCVDECKIGDKYYYIKKGNTEKICYYSCPPSHPFVERVSSDQREPYQCIEDCGKGKFYYEDKKVCRDTCDNLYKNESENNQICVYQCEPGQKVIKKNNKQYCIDSCPVEAPYISNEQLSETNPLIVEKCTNKCPNYYPLKSNSTKKCLTECTLSESYKYEGICYEKCPNGTFSDEYNRICYKDKCPTDFKYYETDEDGINICKKDCTPGKFSLLEGGECMEKCPEQYKYIGFNKICIKECSGIYGEYKEKKGDIDNYNCLKTCGIDKYTVNDTKECVSECDSNKYYTSLTNKICYEKCVIDKNFPFSTHDETGKKICAIKCKDSEPNYGDDKVCKNGCGDNLIIDYDGACVSECKNLYYKYIDIDNKKCTNECTKFITKDNKCVNKCEIPYNYIEGKECKKQCDSNYFSQEIETNIFNCSTKCDKDKYYYETGSYYLQKKCLPKCANDNHFVIQDTQICISECPSPYKSYYNDNKETSISIYQPNLCVLQCPPDKPYSYNNKCLKECPSGNQYHIEGENICIKECPEGSKIDQNTCKSICPEEKKFLDINDKCVSNCPSRYQYYIEGIYKCLPNCENDYKEEDKCVTSCSDKNPYLIEEEKKCSNKCKDNIENFVVKNFTHNEIDVQRKCLSKCPQNYTYFEIYKENDTEIKFCVDKCHYKKGDTEECLLKCEGEYPFYDYKNGKCLKECPSQIIFYVDDTVNGYFVCYEKCPSHIPYFNKSNNYKCMETCETKIINITNKECLSECNGKKYTDSGITYCLNECEELGLFKFGDNQCVKDCSNINGENLENLVVNMETKTCQCKNLFYYDKDNNNKIKCISDENCPEEGYKLRLFDTNQCIDNCSINDSYTLSFDEKYCLPSEKYCPINTKKRDYNDSIAKYKCDCSYKYINGIPKICLSENEECPSNYQFLDGETNECKSNEADCPNDKYIIMDKICLLRESCTDNNNYWEIDENNQYKCINERDCLFNVENTKQCVKNCTNSIYNIYSYINGKNKCLSSCKFINNTKIQTVQNSGQLYYKCVCTDLWYKENNIIYCNEDDDIKTCKEFNENHTYLIKDTNECVDTCKGDYQFQFDSECFKSCEDVKRYYGFDVETNDKYCKCKNLWKKVNNKTICINNYDLCYEDNYTLLEYDTKECISNCPTGYKMFNHTCYNESCPSYTTFDEDNQSCKCINKWYNYNDKSLDIENIIICFESENDDCPKDFYSYLNIPSKQCVEECPPSTKIFNYSCYEECPNFTIPTGDSKSCICNKSEGVWYKFTFEGKLLYKCGLNECPQDKKYLDNDSNECIFSCGNKYHYQGICYLKCPNNTQLVDEISKECVESFTFNDPEDLESLEENVETNILEIYNKSSSGGIVYNLNNSTMQIYGVNKKKSENKDLIMRTNLTYIDLSNCIDALYEKKRLQSDTDLIIVKYDRGDITNSTTINPVEYKVFDSKNGNTITLKDVCEDNSIIISYPLSTILNNFLTDQNLRNLEEKKENLNLREKFLKGKELNSLDEEIDSFNFDNKLYTDICYNCKINGKDLILEDRFNYLYPLYSFCESNCIYDKTDFILERVYCNCTPRSDFNLERNFELLNIDANVEKVKDNQKGSILKCISQVKNISKNFGFFYGLIIILVEIGLAILTILYSYKVFLMNIKNQFDINGDEKIHNIDTENIENLSVSKKNKNKNEEMIKTSERNLEYPPKKNKKVKVNIIDDKEDKKSDTKKKGKEKNKEKEKENDAEVINIKKIKINKNIYDNQNEKLSSKNSNNSYDEKSSALTFKNMEEENIFDYIKLEKKLLTVDYNNAIQKNKAEILIMILTEILDKIYIIKAIWLLQKYELFSLYFSLYLLWHMLILSFLSLFYNNTNLHKIWIEDNYPNLNYHLSFGFLSCIISFVIYRGLYFLINNDKKINEIESIDKERKDEIEQQYKKMMFWAQIKIIIFYAVQLILIIIFYLYLIAFFGIYDGTSSKLVESYGVALIEVIIIKILYGLILGILRKISLVYKIEKLYSIVRFLNLYIA